jgi:ribosome-binding factor A
MAQGRRVERVAALIRREVSELLVNGIKDERVGLGMVSVTNVDVAGDLQHCKVFVSIYGSDDDRSQAMAGLRSAAPYVKGELARRLKLRRTPEVVFLLDRSIEKGTSVLSLLNQLERQREERGEPPAENADDRSNDGIDQAHDQTSNGENIGDRGRDPSGG